MIENFIRMGEYRINFLECIQMHTFLIYAPFRFMQPQFRILGYSKLAPAPYTQFMRQVSALVLRLVLIN